METGKIEIQVKEETQQLSVRIQLSEDGTVWFTKHQIADLFGVYIQTVTAGLKTVFQKELLLQEKVTKVHRFTNEAGKECQTELYNLEVILTLWFLYERWNLPILQGMGTRTDKIPHCLPSKSAHPDSIWANLNIIGN